MDVGIATSALGAFSTVKPLGLPRILVDGETQAPGVGTVQLRPLAMPTWRIPSAVFSASHTAPYFVSANVCASARLLLHEAARNGDASTVRHMLASGSGDIRMIDPVTGYSALMLAAQHGHADVVSALCEKSFTVDMHRQDAQGNTALMLAAMAGDAAIVALLGQLGANAYQEDNKGNTALMKIAACGARIDIARLLVDLGADPTHRNHAGKTAADLATMEGDLLTAAALAGMAAEAARGTINGLLSKLNSNTAAKAMVTDKVMASTYGMPPATAPVTANARVASHTSFSGPSSAPGLVKGAHAQPARDAGSPPAKPGRSGAGEARSGHPKGKRLAKATRPGRALRMPVMPDGSVASQYGSSSNAVDSHEAKPHSRLARASTQLAHSSSPSSNDMAESSAQFRLSDVFQAVERNNVPALRTLLQEMQSSGKKIKVKLRCAIELHLPGDSFLGNRKVTPVMLAASLGYADSLALLIHFGAEIDCADAGVTALMRAAGHGHAATVRVLLRHGVMIDQAGHDGKTALMFAAAGGHLRVMQTLIQAGAGIDQLGPRGLTVLLVAANYERTAAVQALLKAGADVNAATRRGSTALMAAARLNDTATLKVLLKAGARTALARLSGMTALMYAAEAGSDSAVQLLLAAGASIDQVNGNGATALMLAAWEGHYKTVRILLKAGADFSIEAQDAGRTALTIAIKRQHPMCVSVLREWETEPDSTSE